VPLQVDAAGIAPDRKLWSQNGRPTAWYAESWPHRYLAGHLVAYHYLPSLHHRTLSCRMRTEPDTQGEPWTATADGAVIDVRLTPRGGRDAIEGVERRADGRAVFKARVRAAPSDGEANAALCRLIADAVDVARRDVTIVAGATSRVKRVRVSGQTAAILAALRRLAAGDS
jgi:uncharacterized protein (TIGR00251 family)